jgi:hypothetical protein
MGRRSGRVRRVEKVLHRGEVTVYKDAHGSRVLTPEEAAAHAARVSSSSSETEPVELERAEGEPCYGCVCCQEWAASLSQLRTAIGNHEFIRTVAGGACPPDCLVCIGGAGGEWQR